MPEQDQPERRLNQMIPADLHQRSHQLRIRQGVPHKQWVIDALYREVERQEAAQAEAERKRRSSR